MFTQKGRQEASTPKSSNDAKQQHAPTAKPETGMFFLELFVKIGLKVEKSNIESSH